MRILLLSNLYPPFVEGGAEILAEQIAAGLEGHEHEVVVLTSKKANPNLPEGDRKGAPLLYTEAFGKEGYHHRFPEKKIDLNDVSQRDVILQKPYPPPTGDHKGSPPDRPSTLAPTEIPFAIQRAGTARESHTPHPRATIKAHHPTTRPPSPLRKFHLRFRLLGHHWRLTALPSSIWIRRPGQGKRPFTSSLGGPGQRKRPHSPTSTPLSLRGENERTLRNLEYTTTVHFDWKGSLWEQLMKPFRFYRRFHNARNARIIREVVEGTSPDMVYVWEITGIGVNSILRVLQELHVPIVFHVGSYWLLYARSPETEQSRLHMRWLKRLLIGPVPELTWTSMIAVSDAVKEKYERAGFDAERIEVIYNGIDSRFLASPRAACHEDEAFHLLYVGRIRAEKGAMVILKALTLLVHDGHDYVTPLRLHIVGDGYQAYVRQLKAFLIEHGLTEMVVFHGKVPQDTLLSYYDCSQVLLVPSLWQEPFGMVVIEAMARGLTVIASDVGGLREIITDGQNGLLVEAGDERALASAIHALMQDGEKRQRLGEAARVTVEQRFLIGETVSRVEMHLKRICDG